MPAIKTQVAVIGGGFAGTWVALKLARAGIDTVIVQYSGRDRGGLQGSSIRSVGAVNMAPIEKPDFKAFMEELGQGQHHPSVLKALSAYFAEEVSELRTFGDFKSIKLGIALANDNSATFLENLQKIYKSHGGRILDAWVTRIVVDEWGCRGVQYEKDGAIGKLHAQAIVLAGGGYAGLYEGSVRTHNYGTLLGRYLQAGGAASNLEFVFKHGYGKPDLGALTPTEELPGAEVYDNDRNHVVWLERELYEGRGTANHLEAFRHWRGNKEREFFIDLSYQQLYRKIAAVNAALAGGRQQDLTSAIEQILEMCPPETRSECAGKLTGWVQTRERVDFDAFNELKPLFKEVADGEVFRVRQIAYFSMGGVAHTDFITNLPDVYVTGEAMHDFGAHRVGGLPWGLYMASGRAIAEALIHQLNHSEPRRIRDFDLIAQPACFDGGVLHELRRGMYKYQEDNLNEDDALVFIDWIRSARRELILRNEVMHDAFSWLVVAESIMRASLCRKESRGCFYRVDCPTESAYLAKWHTYVTYDYENDEVRAELRRPSDLASMLRDEAAEKVRYVVA